MFLALSGFSWWPQKLRLPSPGVASIPVYPIAGDKTKIDALREKYGAVGFDAELRACVDDPKKAGSAGFIICGTSRLR